MPDPDNNKKRRPLKNLPPDSFPLKMVLFWIIGIGGLVALFYLNPARSPQPATLKIQQVVELAEQDKISEGYIRSDSQGGRDWSIVTGETKDPVLHNDSGGATKAFVATGRLTDSSLEILQKSKAFTEKPATTVMTQLVYNILPFVIVIGLLYFLFVRQLRQAGKGAPTFGKRRAKLLTRATDRITSADFAGRDEAKEEVR